MLLPVIQNNNTQLVKSVTNHNRIRGAQKLRRAPQCATKSLLSISFSLIQVELIRLMVSLFSISLTDCA